MNDLNQNFKTDFNRRKFLSSVGKGFGMMALSSTVVASLFENLQARTHGIEHLSPGLLEAGGPARFGDDQGDKSGSLGQKADPLFPRRVHDRHRASHGSAHQQRGGGGVGVRSGVRSDDQVAAVDVSARRSAVGDLGPRVV